MKTGLKQIYLHGRLGEQFGTRFDLAVTSPAEAVRALSFQLKGFREAIRDGNWLVVRGEPETGEPMTQSMLRMNQGRAPVHIMPATVGSGHGGSGKIIIGVALIAVAIATMQPEVAAFGDPAAGGVAAAAGGLSTSVIGGITSGQIAGLGLALTLSGISAVVSPAPKAAIGQDANSSYLFTGATQTTAEGNPIPLVYGTVLVGSIVAATDLTTADYGNQAATTGLTAAGKTGSIYSMSC